MFGPNHSSYEFAPPHGTTFVQHPPNYVRIMFQKSDARMVYDWLIKNAADLLLLVESLEKEAKEVPIVLSVPVNPEIKGQQPVEVKPLAGTISRCDSQSGSSQCLLYNGHPGDHIASGGLRWKPEANVTVVPDLEVQQGSISGNPEK